MKLFPGSYIYRDDKIAGVVNKVNEDGSVEVLINVAARSGEWYLLKTDAAKVLDEMAEQCYGVKRQPGQTDDELNAACEAKLSAFLARDGFTYHDEVIKPICDAALVKRRKYPGECPCGIRSDDCTYHRGV